MPDVIESPASEPVALPSSPAADPPQESADESSVADHAAQFSPIPSQRETPQTDTPAETKPRERHRAQSQKAGPADVPRINELTKKLREAEAELQRLRTAPASTPTIQTPPAAERRIEPQTPATQSADGFSEKEPTLEDFMGHDDPYAAWQRSLARYDRRKDEWEAGAAKRQAEQQQAQETASAAERAVLQSFGQRSQELAKAKPDFQYVIAPIADIEPTPLLRKVLLESDNGPELLYHLGQHLDLFDEIMLQTDGKAVSEQSVAILRRRLTSQLNRTQAAATGSAAAMTPTSWTSRPPNPVRTSPLRTGDDPPGDGHSLAEHAKHFDPKRRR